MGRVRQPTLLSLASVGRRWVEQGVAQGVAPVGAGQDVEWNSVPVDFGVKCLMRAKKIPAEPKPCGDKCECLIT